MPRPGSPADADLRRTRDQLTTVLASWALASVLGGAGCVLVAVKRGDQQLRAFGRQTAAWGVVDGTIAALGRMRGPTTTDPARASARLRRVLLGNAVADLGYLAAGAAMIRYADRPGRRNGYSTAAARGDGAAVLVQGLFLFVLDVAVANRLRPSTGQRVNE